MFDQIVDRTKTNSAKWDESVEASHSKEVISMSVADMDFRAPPEVIQSLIKMAEHGIYGYTNLSEKYIESVRNWIRKMYRWEIRKEWIVYCPRIVQAVSLVVQNHTEPGDNILVQTPLYGPLMNAIQLNERNLVKNPLLYKDHQYEIDFKEEKFSKGVKAFIFCSPHNPVGRVWKECEIEKIVKLCAKYDVLLISDEVHADFTWEIPHTTVGKFTHIYNQMIICTSPGKTFNIPGLEVSNIIIPNDKLREQFNLLLQQTGFHNPTFFAVPALEAAYSHGEKWLEKLKTYIRENYLLACEFFEKNIPEFKITPSEGTYLMWINYQQSGLREKDLEKWLFEDAKVTVSLGSSFGVEGEGFIRLNIALPRKKLQEGLDRILATCPFKDREEQYE